MRHYTLALALLLALPAFAQDIFRVGPVSAASGESASGFLEVPAGVDAGTQIPITVFHGARPGRTLALVAGTHGYEYSPILALQRLRGRIEARQLSGNLILVHVANLPSFLKRTIYYSPVDGKNLNRVFPGKADGTVSERIAYVLTREVIERADAVVDLHCGDGNESLRPYTYWIDSGRAEVDEAARQMALAFGFDHIVIDRDRPRDPAAAVYLSNTAITRNKPALTVESGGLGEVPGNYLATDEHIDAIERGVRNLMKHLGLIEGKPQRLVAQPVWIDRNEVLRSAQTGIWWPVVKKGHTVPAGATIGVITDFFAKTVTEVKAPFAGEILYVVSTPPTSPGEPLAMIGRAKPD